jgi:quercetin dioxygenase-like cupin family protein
MDGGLQRSGRCDVLRDMPKAPKVIHIDELDAIPGPGSLMWRPVRRTLGVRAFGCNAYTAGAAGDDVVEPHSEEPDVQQELYFVATGRATFTIDGQSHDAPAGTYVFVPDPESHRHAVAVEAGTTVLSFGGPPTFEPSAWEWSSLAAPLITTDPRRAREILSEGLEAHPNSASLHYNLACVDAREARHEEALDSLRLAVKARPEVADWAREDSDFESLRSDPRFQQLTGA